MSFAKYEPETGDIVFRFQIFFILGSTGIYYWRIALHSKKKIQKGYLIIQF